MDSETQQSLKSQHNTPINIEFNENSQDNSTFGKLDNEGCEKKKLKRLFKNPSNPLNKTPQRIKYLRESLKQYHFIRKNKYLDRKKKNLVEEDIYICQCQQKSDIETQDEDFFTKNISFNCGVRCLNRMMCTECDPGTCPCGELCTNIRFQKHQYACVYPFPTEGKGWGLKAGEPIKKGQFVIQYIGEVLNITSEEGRKRLNLYSNSTCTYLMKTCNNEVIDPTYRGNMARFINHSCDPNCISEKWFVLGETCVGIFAKRNIEEDEELSFDYKFDCYKTPLCKCLCGSSNCKGYLGLKPTEMPMDDWDDQLENMPCEICGMNIKEEEDKLLLCDSCNKGFHTFCLDPPIYEIPKEQWFCESCIQDQEENSVDSKQETSKQTSHIIKENSRKMLMNEMRSNLVGDMSDNSDDEEALQKDRDYENYQLMKKLQREAIKELYGFDEEFETQLEERKIKRKKKKQPSARKQSFLGDEKSKLHKEEEERESNRKKRIEELQTLKRLIEEKFQENLIKNQQLLSKVNFCQVQLEQYQDDIEQQITQKRIIKVSYLGLQLLRANFVLFEQIGCKTFWEHRTNSQDYFNANIELGVIGVQLQLQLASQIIDLINLTVVNLKKEMGIIEGHLTVPCIFLKKILGVNHQNLLRLEKLHSVNISYDKRFYNDECYSITQHMNLIVKGNKDNFLRLHADIQEIINQQQTKRIYLNQCDLRIILNHLTTLKRQINNVEIRINREQPFKEINHPFFFIHCKDKELVLIGFEQDIQQAENVIVDFIRQQSQKEGGTILTYNYLMPAYMKQSIILIKYEVESEVQGCKVIIYDPTHPRKNITVSLTGVAETIQKSKKILIHKINNLNSSQLEFSTFQNQVEYQSIKYLFKYLQNAILADEVAFMKSWDILSRDFGSNSQKSWLQNTLKDGIQKDWELLLYVIFVRSLQIEVIERQFGLKFNDVINVLKGLMSRTLNSNPNMIKNYSSIFSLRNVYKMLKNLELNKFSNPETIKNLIELKHNIHQQNSKTATDEALSNQRSYKIRHSKYQNQEKQDKQKKKGFRDKVQEECIDYKARSRSRSKERKRKNSRSNSIEKQYPQQKQKKWLTQESRNKQDKQDQYIILQSKRIQSHNSHSKSQSINSEEGAFRKISPQKGKYSFDQRIDLERFLKDSSRRGGGIFERQLIKKIKVQKKYHKKKVKNSDSLSISSKYSSCKKSNHSLQQENEYESYISGELIQSNKIIKNISRSSSKHSLQKDKNDQVVNEEYYQKKQKTLNKKENEKGFRSYWGRDQDVNQRSPSSQKKTFFEKSRQKLRNQNQMDQSRSRSRVSKTFSSSSSHSKKTNSQRSSNNRKSNRNQISTKRNREDQKNCYEKQKKHRNQDQSNNKNKAQSRSSKTTKLKNNFQNLDEEKGSKDNQKNQKENQEKNQQTISCV